MSPVSVAEGSCPIILGQPHSGVFVPADIMAQLNPLGQQLLDTDWHIPQLYEDVIDDVTIVKANFSRYVIDANRDPNDESLYPGQNTTSLVPLSTFDGHAIWQQVPSDTDVFRRVEQFHRPYHAALQQQIARLQQTHDHVVLYDCHSIRSQIPFLFDGPLPDLNIGSFSGASCASVLIDAIATLCEKEHEFSHVVDGRFKGGWTTRHYGQPKSGVHAIQMEIAQHCYLQTEQPPFAYDTEKAKHLTRVLRRVMSHISENIHRIALEGTK